MFTSLWKILGVAGLLGLSLTLPARADYYRGYYEVEDIERQGLKLSGIARGDVVEVEFHYIPNLNSYIVFEPRPGRKEQFWQHANGLIQQVKLPSFWEVAEVTEDNFFDKRRDRVHIQNVVGMPDYKLFVSEEFHDRVGTGVSKKVALAFDVPVFEVDLAAITDLTLLNGQWETLPKQTLTLQVQDVRTKPKQVVLKGRLLKLECLAGSCYRELVEAPAETLDPESVLFETQTTEPE